jgi:predicted nucleic acid-binding protein
VIIKAFIETSMFNYNFDDDREHHLDTVAFFAACLAGRFEPYTSAYVIDEILAAPEEKQLKMLSLIDRYGMTVLPASNVIDNLALLYLYEGALPRKSLTDASHIASATIHNLDLVVSLNFRHVVRPRTEKMTGEINIRLGYKPVQLSSPMGVI